MNQTEVHILLVEDNALNQMIITKLVQKIPYKLTLADDGDEALKYVQDERQPIDLVLMDLHLPNMDGYQTVRKIRALPQGRDLPIVALTAGKEQDLPHHVEEAGMIALLSKPINIEALKEIVNDHVMPRK